MKPPTWAYVIGILMLLFGGCGVIQDYQNIHAPKFLEMGEGIVDEIEREIEEDIREERIEAKKEYEEHSSESVKSEEEMDSSQESSSESEEMTSSEDEESHDGQEELEMVKNILNVSDYYKTWMVRFGYIGIVISVLFILAGIFLMIPKKFSISLAYGVLGLSIIVGIIQYIIFSQDDSSGMVTMFSGLSVIFSVVVDFILLAVIVASDKDVYYALSDEMMDS